MRIDTIAKKMIGLFFINLLSTTWLCAELKIGESFPAFVLLNSHNQKLMVPKKGVVTLLLSFEKDSSVEIQNFLKKQEHDFLVQHHMMYISDVSSLPKFLINLFVLPKLKVFKFDVALLYEENSLNREEKKITIVHLKDSVVTDIKFIETAKLEEFMVKATSF